MAISLPYMEIGADTDRSDGTSRKEKKKESAKGQLISRANFKVFI